MATKPRVLPRALPTALAVLLSLASPLILAAQTLDYSSLLDTGADDDADSGLDLGKILNQQLLQQLLKVSPAPSPAAVQPSASPAPTPAFRYACPLCGESFPGTAPYKGVAWGYRLDLRMYGRIKDPPDAPLCPACRFPIFRSAFGETELSRLRPYVNSGEYKSIDPRHVPYYYVARLREKGLLSSKNGDYDIAHAFLQAAWQAEDLGDKALESGYLERALFYAERHGKAAKKDDPYYQTAKILTAELLRRLGRFAEAESALRSIEKAPEFSATFLQDIISSELAYIRLEDSAPH